MNKKEISIIPHRKKIISPFQEKILGVNLEITRTGFFGGLSAQMLNNRKLYMGETSVDGWEAENFERITDHAVNILESSEELREKEIKFTEKGIKEMTSLCQATLDIVNLSHDAFIKNDIEIANLVEPLEEVTVSERINSAGSTVVVNLC